MNEERFEITSEILLKAYACGLFPMAETAEDRNLFWVDPETRGVLPLAEFHIPRRLKRTIKNRDWDIRINTDFDGVIEGCAEETTTRENTWINPRIRALYRDLFDIGHCHTVEVWQDDKLTAGLYGVHLGAAFFGESMFTRVTDGSKVALVHLVARLITGGFDLLDTQFLTEHLATFGTIEIARADYQIMLAQAISKSGDFYSLGGGTSDSILQVFNQTS